MLEELDAGSVAIAGGCGRVGLPLGLAFAASGRNVVLYDIDGAVVDRVRSGEMPFEEPGAADILTKVLENGSLTATTEASSVESAEHVVVVVGTPVDEHLNPDPSVVVGAIEAMLGHLRDGQHMVLRSTIYPGVTAMIEQLLERNELDIDVSFCPERIAEGKAMEELHQLPQIVSARTDRALRRATELFGDLTDTVIPLEVEEAELAKLITNTWRYIKFAAANQLFMIANDFGVDFERIRSAISEDYPRAMDLPGPGLAAGPCLLKDTMQLAAFNNNNFTLGHASMTINEGLPLYLIHRAEQRFDLSEMTVGILGMAFKGGSDDTRDSLSYKLRRLLRFKAKEVLCTDEHVTSDPDLRPLDEVLAHADLLVIGAPHDAYAKIDTTVPVIDVWNLLGRGVLT